MTAYRLEQNDFHITSGRRGQSVAERLIAFLCQRLRETSYQLESIALHPMHVRLARFFVVVVGDRKPLAGKRMPIELGMSQSEIALLLGASRPKINEALGTLEKIGSDQPDHRSHLLRSGEARRDRAFDECLELIGRNRPGVFGGILAFLVLRRPSWSRRRIG